MRRFVSFLILIFISSQNFAFADVTFFNENKKFGAKDVDGNVVIEPVYNKIIRLGESGLIVQKRNKYGIIDFNGNILVPLKYRHAERVLTKYVKLGNYGDFGLFNEKGEAILSPEFDRIDLLFGGMLLIYKNYKFGVADFSGKIILDNKFDDIYMPKPHVMVIEYQGEKYEIEQVSAKTLCLPDDFDSIKDNKEFKVTNIVNNTGVVSGYSVLTFTDYLIKLISSISPAHEDTIDQLMLSQGADTVSLFIKLTWLPKYPFNYARNYYRYVRNPNNGPLTNVRTKLKKKIK